MENKSNELTISKIKTKKVTLESDIFELVRKFETETDLSINKIDLYKIQSFGDIKNITVSVETSINI